MLSNVLLLEFPHCLNKLMCTTVPYVMGQVKHKMRKITFVFTAYVRKVNGVYILQHKGPNRLNA